MTGPAAGDRAGAPGTPSCILLVDDDWMGQKLGTAVLEEMGYEVVCAGSGAEAIEQWEQGTVDLILMDVQMPEMDGCAATRLIRAAEADSGRRVPIVALTGDTGEADRQACLSAGMDDYLAKPIDPAALREAIGRVQAQADGILTPAGPGEPGEDGEVADLLAQLGLAPLPDLEEGDAGVEIPAETLARIEAEFAATPGDQVLDEQSLCRLAELEARGALSLATIAALFCDGGSRILPALRAAVVVGDAALLRQEAHTLKGNARDVGAHRLAGVCEELEARARDGQLDRAPALIEQIEVAWSEALQALQGYLNRQR